MGCSATPQTISVRQNPPQVNESHQIGSVPFFPQKQFYCGPTTIAEIVSFYGKNTTPDDIAPMLFVPNKEGTFQIEMVASARSHGLLAYQDRGTLELLLKLLDDNTPVIVFQNLSIDWFPMWHYAVVKGYDLKEEKFYLHSGTIKNHETDFATFERTWRRGNFWLLAPVPPDKISHHFSSFVVARSAQDLMSVGQTRAGLVALETSTKVWPDYWLPYFLLGNYYLDKQVSTSIKWFELGLSYSLNQAPYLNNYAYALKDTKQLDKALYYASKAKELAPDNQDILDTHQSIKKLIKISNQEK